MSNDESNDDPGDDSELYASLERSAYGQNFVLLFCGIAMVISTVLTLVVDAAGGDADPLRVVTALMIVLIASFWIIRLLTGALMARRRRLDREAAERRERLVGLDATLRDAQERLASLRRTQKFNREVAEALNRLDRHHERYVRYEEAKRQEEEAKRQEGEKGRDGDGPA